MNVHLIVLIIIHLVRENKVAEIVALGDIDTNEVKSCTNKIQIIREIPWDELLKIVNKGKIVRVCVTLEAGTLETTTLETGTNLHLITVVL